MTHDAYADFQPAWSPDGKKIAFVSDRTRTEFHYLSFSGTDIMLLDYNDRSIQPLGLFSDSKNFNPQFSPDGKSICFISNSGGFANIYRHSLTDHANYRITQVATGISGITDLSPAMSISSGTGEIMFSVFKDAGYSIHALKPESFHENKIDPVNATDGGKLPQLQKTIPSLADSLLQASDGGLPQNMSLKIESYHPHLSLDYLGQMGTIGFNPSGSVIGGDLIGFFSDMLGNHRLAVALAANNINSFKDVGGQVYYQFLKHKLQFGILLSHIPFVNTASYTGVESNGKDYIGQLIQRLTYNQAAIITSLPLSMNRRLELTTGFSRYGYQMEYIRYFEDGTKDEELLASPPPINLFNTGLAYVGDYSYFGFTSPFRGRRYRISIEPTWGSLQYVTALADYRHYFFFKPFTFAVRNMLMARMGRDAANDNLQPMFLGFETLLRGYSSASFSSDECEDETGNRCPSFDRLIGSRINVLNMEIRVPVLGVRNFGLFHFPWVPLELGAFADAGIAWTQEEKPEFRLATRSQGRIPVFSTGLSTRINILNALILEFYYVYPFQRPLKGWHFGFTVSPGW
jgi:hypothetical protein